MKNVKRSLIILAAVIVIVVIALWVFLPSLFYSVQRFQGDGTITDNGIISYPRYRVEFPPISLGVPGKYEYHCMGVPPAPMTCALFIIDQAQTEEEVTEIVGDATVQYMCADSKGNTVFEVNKPLKEWTLSWTPFNRPYNCFYSLETCDIKLKQDVRYTVTITVEKPARNDSIKLRPGFDGGGIEILP